MQIYIYLRSFPRHGSPINGGLNKAVHGLACGLVRAGARVTILCENVEATRVLSESGYEIRCFPTTSKPPTFHVSEGLRLFVETKMEPGIVLINGIFMPSASSVARLMRKNKVPYICCPHDPYHPELFRDGWWMKWPYWFLLERPMLRGAMAVQVLDERHRDYLRKLDVETSVVPLPNGYLPAEAEREPTMPDGGDPRLIFLGRMDAHNKGLDLLIDAFSQLCDVTDAKLTLQGPVKPDRAALERRAADLIAAGRVQFLDPDFARPSSAVISGHHIFCLPSRFEGFGLAALEAMLAERVVLVTEIAGIAPHVIASGCGVVVPCDVKSICQGLWELLSRREEWMEMGRRGREYALKHLNWDQIGEQAMKEYARMCKDIFMPDREHKFTTSRTPTQLGGQANVIDRPGAALNRSNLPVKRI